MAVRGVVQFDEIKGPREDDTSTIYEFSITGQMPRNKLTGVPTGSRFYDEFSVVKEIDRSTPEIWKAMSTGQTLKKVEITLFHIAAETGTEKEYFRFTLHETRVSSVRDFMPSTFDETGDSTGHLEEVKLMAMEYEWTHLLDNTMHIDANKFDKAGDT